MKADSVDLTSAGNIAEWERVIKVKIHLLADSLSSGVLESSQTKTYYDGNLSVTDARLHKEFRNQVVIRNKVL